MHSRLRESLQESAIIYRFALPGAITSLTAMPAIWIASAALVRQPHGLGEMALFSAANSFRSMVLFLPGVLAGTALPSLNDARGRRDPVSFGATYWSTLRLTLGSTAVAAIVISLSGPILLPIYGKEFGAGAATLAILMGTTVLEGMVGITTAAFQTTARMWTFLFAVVLPRDATLVVLAHLLTPSWGAVGLASAYASATSVSAIVLAILTWRTRILRGRWDPEVPERSHAR
jgi:O-antigen/teichoic acid export membrane protein